MKHLLIDAEIGMFLALSLQWWSIFVFRNITAAVASTFLYYGSILAIIVLAPHSH